MKFSDLQFKTFPGFPGDTCEHILAQTFFPNGYGVSVVRFSGSYGYEDGLYEVAVLQGTEDNFDLCYDTPITDDVIGYCDEQIIENIIKQVESL